MHKRISILSLILILAIAAFAGAQEEGKRPLILISNDDGYDTPGIRALATAFAELGDVIVVAPKSNQSGSSQSIIYRVPIFFGKADPIGETPVWWVDATPATTVRFALGSLLKEHQPDLVVSGINRGANIGDAVYYSGTIGAAREGALHGIPALAVSMESRGSDFDGAAAAAARIARVYLSIDNRPELLNVNIPEGKISESTPVQVTTAGAGEANGSFEIRDNPQRPGQQYYWEMFGGYTNAGPGSDLDALQQGAISVMPVRVNLVDSEKVKSLRKAFAR